MSLITDQIRFIVPLYNGRIGKEIKPYISFGDYPLFVFNRYDIWTPEGRTKAVKKLFKRILYKWWDYSAWGMTDEDMLKYMTYGDCGLNYKIIPIDGTNDSGVVIWQDYSNEYLGRKGCKLVFDFFIARGCSVDLLEKNIKPLAFEIGYTAQDTMDKIEDDEDFDVKFSHTHSLEVAVCKKIRLE